jgi:predicted nucleotidyltransferase
VKTIALDKINIPIGALTQVCERYHVQRLAVFGSVLRADFRPESDIDVLVEFEANQPVTLLDLAGLQIDLIELFGRQVDLGTPSGLSKYIRQGVLDTAQVIYERT